MGAGWLSVSRTERHSVRKSEGTERSLEPLCICSLDSKPQIARSCDCMAEEGRRQTIRTCGIHFHGGAGLSEPGSAGRQSRFTESPPAGQEGEGCEDQQNPEGDQDLDQGQAGSVSQLQVLRLWSDLVYSPEQVPLRKLFLMQVLSGQPIPNGIKHGATPN
ncbi:MAG: hypothetical protein MH204_10455 [Fimbriimonadaceae bacterium]|nr:hypothetical protein [Fimbriimonadaceae bacterium]